ncbi:MAG: vitamin B12 ABC transporter substrate-binding protein BtuF [Vibrio sp.]
MPLYLRLLGIGILLAAVSSASWATPAQRVISLSPHATELAFAAGLGSQLVGVSQASDYPPAAKHIERVANFKGINVDRIIALQPDLIISWPEGNPAKVITMLKQMGYDIYPASIRHLDDIATHVRDLSQYANNPAQGRKTAHELMTQLNALKRRYQNASPVRYFYQISAKPLITMARGSWPSDVFSLCGGVNVFANSPSPYPQVSIEQVLLAQPLAIFSTQANSMQPWNNWHDELPAFQQHHVWQLNADWLNRATPRTIKAVRQVCDYFAQVRKN